MKPFKISLGYLLFANGLLFSSPEDSMLSKYPVSFELLSGSEFIHHHNYLILSPQISTKAGFSNLQLVWEQSDNSFVPRLMKYDFQKQTIAFGTFPKFVTKSTITPDLMFIKFSAIFNESEKGRSLNPYFFFPCRLENEKKPTLSFVNKPTLYYFDNESLFRFLGSSYSNHKLFFLSYSNNASLVSLHPIVLSNGLEAFNLLKKNVRNKMNSDQFIILYDLSSYPNRRNPNSAILK